MIRTRQLIRAALLAFGLPWGATGGGFAAGATDLGGIDVTIKTVDEEAAAGTLRSLTIADGAMLEPTSGDPRRIALTDIVRITTGSRPSPLRRSEFTLTLTNGDELSGDLETPPEDCVVIDTIDLGSITVPLDWVARIDAARATQAAHRDAVDWLDRSGARDEDRVLLANGDTLRGFITAVGPDGIAIDAAVGPTVVPQRLVVAARLLSPRPAPPPPPYLVAALRTSGRLTLTDLRWSGAVVEARTAFNRPVRVEAERFVRVDVVGGRWEWLTRIEPADAEHTPMLSLEFSAETDRNVLGGPLTVAGDRYDRGIGVHSRSRLAYDLSGAYRRFVTTFGIDDDSGPLADVTVSILVDGHRRFELEHVRRGRLHGPVSLDVSGAGRLELIVDFGDNGDIQDRFDWIEPALIR